ncbi:MAG: hypothetical protein ACYDAQ_18265 [Mycobacteriales bacterium]
MVAAGAGSPKNGEIIFSAVGPTVGLGQVGIAAADHHAWNSFATGLQGGYVQVQAGGATLTMFAATGAREFANGISAHLADGRLWILDEMSAAIACANEGTGRILAETRLGPRTSDSPGVVGDGELALFWGPKVLLVQPRPTSADSARIGLLLLREHRLSALPWRAGVSLWPSS